jgi:hypothetical protein
VLSKNTKIKIYKTIIFHVVLYGCETWLFTVGEEHRLRVFENRMLKRILGPKSDEVRRERRKLHSEELNYLYSSPEIVQAIKLRRMRWAGHVKRMRERRGVYRGLVGKPEGRRPLERLRHRWEGNINTLGTGYLNCLYAYKRKSASPVLNVLRYSGSGMWGYGLDQAGPG